MLTDGSAIMGELSQGQMSDLSQASANENSGPPAPTPPGSADVLRAKQCMRLQISLDADTYMCSWAEELERQEQEEQRLRAAAVQSMQRTPAPWPELPPELLHEAEEFARGFGLELRKLTVTVELQALLEAGGAWQHSWGRSWPPMTEKQPKLQVQLEAPMLSSGRERLMVKRGAFSAAWDVEEPTNYTCVWDRQLV